MILTQRWTIFAAIAGTCLLAGCSSEGAPVCSPVHGQVSFKGKPLAEAMVVLHRVGGDVEGNQKPMAYTGADGKFIVTTYHSGDGAPPGDYAITIELRAPQTVGEEVVRNGPSLLPAKYSKPEASEIKYTVVDGDNQIPPIDVK